MSKTRFFAREEFFGWLLFDTRTQQYVVPVTPGAIRAFHSVVEEATVPKAADLPDANGAQAAAIVRWLNENECLPGSVHISTRSPRPKMLSAPLNVYFDFTSVCNLACTMCYDEPKRAAIKRAHELTVAEIDGIFDQLREMGVFRVDLAGGEPTLFPEVLVEYLASARRRDISVSITTNASRLPMGLARRILEFELKTITVSIDGPDAATNDRVRGLGSFAKALEGVGNLLAAKRELGSKTVIAIKNTFRPTITPDEIHGFVELGQRVGVDKVKFNAMRPSGEAVSDNDLIMNVPAYYAALREMKRLADLSDGVEISGPTNPATCFGGRVPHLTDWGCVAGKELMTIDSIGNVRPCSMMNDFVVGNVRSNSIRDLYLNSSINTLRGLENEECSSCEGFTTCRGGCRVRSQAAGDFFAKDPLCPKDAGQVMVQIIAPPAPFQYLGLPHSL
ncbi:MAG TPA: radical SAM protein [Pyrinomonadaceae bacterium]|nr:radical SAM protein [Pyrinomonadaceae bacterium]